MVAETLDIVMSSMQNDDTIADVRADLFEVLPRSDKAHAADIVVFGETAGGPKHGHYVRQELVEVTTAMGWHLYLTGSDSAIAVNLDRHEAIEESYLKVLDPRNERPGAFSEKGVARVRALTAAGNTVGVSSQHLLTKWVNDKNPGPENRREAYITSQIDAWLEIAELEGEKDGISFVAGDVNMGDIAGVDDRDPDGIYSRLREAGFVTCWDDLGKYPDTHGVGHGTPIDIICRFERDLRVHFVGAEVGSRRHSDHQWVRARYDIDPLPVPEPPKPVRHDCPDCGKRHRIAVVPVPKG